MEYKGFMEYLILNKTSLKEYEERLNEQLALAEKERIRLEKVSAIGKVIYICETEEGFKELCSIFGYPTDVHLNSSEPICLRVEYGEAIGHDSLSWYKSEKVYKNYEFIRYFRGTLKNATDDVKNPKHYRLEGLELEANDIIRSVLGKEGYKSWCHGTALKYLFRAGKKEDELKDFKKAKEYILWIIKEMED